MKPVRVKRTEALLPLFLVLLAVLIRASGLGRWCLGSDEFFLSQSVQFILEKGVPEFPSGGYYVRGIGLQYLTALLAGVIHERELQVRVLPFLFGVLTVPVFYRLCRLFLPPLPSVLAGLILVLSSWHIEFSRFGRFYAPFQFFFVLFVYFLYRGYWLDSGRSRIASWAVAFLSIFVYEGAVFMPVLLLVALASPSGVSKRRYAVLLTAGLLLLANYVVNGGGYRNLGVGEATVEAADSSVETEGGRSLPVVLPPMVLVRSVLGDPVLAAGYCLLGIFALWLLSRTIRSRAAGTDVAILIFGVAFALFHQYGPTILLLAFTALFRREWYERMRGEALPAMLFLALSTGFWSYVLWKTGNVPKYLGYMIGYPPIKYAVVLPYAKTVPLWGALATVALMASFARNLWRKTGASAFLLGLTLLSIVLVSFFVTPYRLTRYTFFLLPLVILVPHVDLHEGLGRISARFPRTASSRAIPALIALPLAAFLASDDFHLRHVLDVSAPVFNFRLAEYRVFDNHWYPRRDFRSPSFFVETHYTEGDRIVIDAIPCSAYLRHPYLFYSDTRSPWFREFTRKGGTEEIWTGRPMITSAHRSLDAIIPKVPREMNRSLWFITAARLKRDGDPGTEFAFDMDGVRVSRVYVGNDERFQVFQIKRVGNGI